jgi:hypothetical protein
VRPERGQPAPDADRRSCSTVIATATMRAMVSAFGTTRVTSYRPTASPKPVRMASTLRQAASAESAMVGCTAITAPSGA